MRRIILNRKYIAKLATRWTTGIFAFLGLIGTFASLSDLLDSSFTLLGPRANPKYLSIFFHLQVYPIIQLHLPSQPLLLL